MNKVYYVLVALVAIGAISFFVLSDGEPEAQYEEVIREDIAREIFETGTVKKGNKINLGFKEAGTVAQLLALEGEKVSQGQILARLDTAQIESAKREAESALDSAQATLDSLLKGATQEEIEVAEARVESAKTRVASANRNLEDAKTTAQETLNDAYKGVASLLSSAYYEARNASEDIEDLVDEHFIYSHIPDTHRAKSSHVSIERAKQEIGKHKNLILENELNFQEKDESLDAVESELKKIIREINNIIEAADSPFYSQKLKESDVKDFRDIREDINGELSGIVSQKQSIASSKASANASLNTAENSLAEAKTALQEAERTLAQVKAGATSESIREQRARVSQAEARLEQVEKRLTDAQITAPLAGLVSDVLIEQGEVALAGSPVLSIIPDQDFQIEVDIYEGDIPEVEIGNRAIVSFVAFPNKEFEGEVIALNEAGKIKDGVVYYTITVIIEEFPEKTLNNMTVDVTIITDSRENALTVPERALFRKEGQSYVIVLENGETREVKVETGLRGEGRRIEIISGLEQGDKIVVE